MSYKARILLFLLFITLSSELFSQSKNKSKLKLQPAFHGVQIDGTSIVFINAVTGNLDFDLLRSKSKTCIGFRGSVEHYSSGNFAGTTLGSPFTNYSFYLRISNSWDFFSTSTFFGISKYESSSPQFVPNKYRTRLGFEIKYGQIVSFILKGVTSFKERTSFFGIGVSLDYSHLY